MPKDLALRRLALFPITTRVEVRQDGECLTIAGCHLGELAGRHGTPLYVYDEATLDTAVEDYRHTLERSYPGEWSITYAGKAFLCQAMAQWVRRRHLSLDCSSAGEVGIASAAGLPRGSIVVHGVNKSQADLAAALGAAGTIVVDSLPELRRLVAVAQQPNASLPELWLRIRPGQAVATHAHNQTGQEDSKFGMEPSEAVQAVRICRQHGLAVTGLHFHLGSQFRDPGPVGLALDTVLDLAADLHATEGWLPHDLCPGGGLGVAYHEDALPQPSIPGYVQFVAGLVVGGCRARGLPLPRLHLEPGRSVVARAGVAVYRVGTVKHTPRRRWLLLDGGLADNPRPALYAARYSALPVWSPRRRASGPAWLAGPYCESGDVLIEDLPLPEMAEGELIAVPVSGAYQLSMASNYNAARKPAVLWLQDGAAHLVQQREQIEDLLRRDRPM